MSKAVKLMKDNASNPKLWIALGIGVVGVVILTETHRRRRRPKATQRVDFGAFVVRFDLLPFPQPPPPAARLPLASLTFAIKDMFVFSHSLLFFVCFIHLRVCKCQIEVYCSTFVCKEILYFFIYNKFGFGGFCRFDVKDYVTGFGNRDWERTHEAARKTAVAVTALLKNGATCVGKTVMDELAFG